MVYSTGGGITTVYITMKYDAVILDNDGVLVEPTPEAVHQTANRLAFRDCGVNVPAESHISGLGNPSVMLLDAICSDYGIDPETFWARRERHGIRAQRYEIQHGGKPAYSDLGAIRSLPVPIGVVSNNQRETVEFILNRHDLADHVDTLYGRLPTVDGLKTLKPDPTYLANAMDDLGTSNVLYVGDSREDIEAAAAIDIDSAFARRPHRRDYELPIDPTYEIKTLDELHRLVNPAETTPTKERSRLY